SPCVASLADCRAKDMVTPAETHAYFQRMAHPLPLIDTIDDAAPTGATAALPCVLDLDLPALQAVVTELGEPAYRAKQVFRAIHGRLVGSWEEITDLPARLRMALSERYRLQSGDLAVQAVSNDGTRKRLVRLAEGQEIETVAIPATSPEGAR